MQELEKILEEIDDCICEWLSTPTDKFDQGYIKGLRRAKKIIYKNMNEKDINTAGELISRQALLDDFRNTITENSDTFDWLNMIARQPTVNKGDGWISVEKNLPPNSKRKGAFCPKYQVMTKYGVTEGWYNPDVESWYVLIWFMTERYLDSEIDFDKGDKPRLLRLPDEVNNVQHILTAWRPLPDPYRPNIQNKPEEHYPEWRTKLLGKFDKRV